MSAAAAAPVVGANPSWLAGPWGMALSLVAPTLLSAIFGPKGSDINAMRSRAQSYLTRDALTAETNNQFADFLNSPALAAMRTQLTQAGQMGTNYINTRLAQMGANTGVGLALGGAAAAAPDVKLAEAIGAGHAEASRRAMEILQARANAEMMGGAVRPMWQDMFGGTMAAAIPYLLDKVKSPTTKTDKTEKTNANNSELDLSRYAPTYGGTPYLINPPNDEPTSKQMIPNPNFVGRQQPLGAYPYAQPGSVDYFDRHAPWGNNNVIPGLGNAAGYRMNWGSLRNMFAHQIKYPGGNYGLPRYNRFRFSPSSDSAFGWGN